MKSVGATSRFITVHFMCLIMVLGVAGTILGLVSSYILQLYFPTLFSGILPAHVTMTIAWTTVLEGLFLGAIVVGLFSFLPLYGIQNLKPAFIFRKETNTKLKEWIPTKKDSSDFITMSVAMFKKKV
jgi:putative ABC transport system permease protein